MNNSNAANINNNNSYNSDNRLCLKSKKISNNQQELVRVPLSSQKINNNNTQPIVSIDSNVRFLAKNVADRVSNNAKSWCLQLNKCDLNVNAKVFYNTPISMADDISKYNFPSNIKHFVYVDFSQNNQTLRRILRNLQYIKNYIVISNADSYVLGSYHLKIGNCLLDAVSDILTIIVVVYQNERRYVKQEELENFICTNKVRKPQFQQTPSKEFNSKDDSNRSLGNSIVPNNTSTTVRNTVGGSNERIEFPIVCDLYRILDRKDNNGEFMEINDCTIFNLNDLTNNNNSNSNSNSIDME